MRLLSLKSFCICLTPECRCPYESD